MNISNNYSVILKERMAMRRTPGGPLVAILAATGLAGIVSCTSTTEMAGGTGDLANRVADGRRFASLRCAACHAMDQDEFGTNPNAPPMKRLLPSLEFKMLERRPPQDVDMTHGAMPPLRLSILEKDALVAYLKSIADSPIR